MMRHHGMHMPDGFFGGLGIIGIFWAILWLAIVIGVIFLLMYIIRKNSRREEHSSKRAIRILEERFARGEIDELEYKEKKRVLEEK